MLAKILMEEDSDKVLEYVEEMGYKDGDMFELVMMNKKPYIFPLIPCTPEQDAEFDRLIANHEADPTPRKSYSCVYEMIKDMGIDLEDED